MTAYRELPNENEITVGCVGCGALTQIASAEGSFGCGACGRQQPARRAEAGGAPSSMKIESHAPAGYTHLIPFARLLGVEVGCSSLSVVCDGVVCQVAVGFSSGTLTGVEVGATAQGLPPAEFRRETADDVESKGSGVARELQTGDRAFDEAVYVESDSADSDLLILLSSPAVRAAIVRLLTFHERVTIDASGVHAKTGCASASTDDFEPKNILASLADVRAIAGAPRPLRPAPPNKNVAFPVALAVAALSGYAGTGAAIAVRERFHTLSHVLPIAGLALGGVLWLAIQPLLRRAMSGRHDSPKTLYIGRVAAFFFLIELGSIGLHLANGLPDRSALQSHEMVVTEIRTNHEDSSTGVTARPVGDRPPFGPQDFSFEDPRNEIKVGQRLTMTTRQGALGFRWRSAPAKLYAGASVLEAE